MENLKNVTNEEINEMDSKMLDELLNVYRTTTSALEVVVDSVLQLGKMGLVDDDIARINAMNNYKVDELMLKVSEINEFKESSEQIFNQFL